MRIRITFSKSGPLTYIGNLDLYTMWERAARRAGLALAYSHGFHPQPKIHFAAPLPLGFSSRCELLDMRLNDEVDCERLPERLNAVLPTGIRVLAAEGVDEAGPALQTRVQSAEYEIRLQQTVDLEAVKQRAEALMRSASLPRQRRTRPYDLRPLIEELQVGSAADPGGIGIRMRLKALEGATGRPDEVLDALDIAREDARIERTRLLLLPSPAESGVHPGAR